MRNYAAGDGLLRRLAAVQLRRCDVGLKLGNLKCLCCGEPCNICSGNQVPEYLLLTIADAVDFPLCAGALAACPSAPDPASEFSALNATIQLDLVPSLSVPDAATCLAWYEGSISYPTFLYTTAGCATKTSASVRFACYISTDGTDWSATLLTYIGDDLYNEIGTWGPVTGSDWVCDSGDTSSAFDDIGDGVTFITAGTGEDAADYFPVIGLFCPGDEPAWPTITMQRSVTSTTL